MRRTRVLLAVALTAAFAQPAAPAAADCTTLSPELPGMAAQVVCATLHPGSLLYVGMPDGPRECVAGFLYTDKSGARYTAVPSRCVYEPVCAELVEIEVPVPLPPLPQPVPGLIELVKQVAKKLVCLEEPSGEEDRFGRNAPVVVDPQGRRVGVVAYAVDKPEARFGLIRLDPGVTASAAVPYWGGPTGVDARSMTLDVVRVMSPSRPNLPGAPHVNARLAPADHRTPTFSFRMYSPATMGPGNFGTVVTTTDGFALGQVDSELLGVGSYVGVRPPLVVARSARTARIDLKLMTAPVAR